MKIILRAILLALVAAATPLFGAPSSGVWSEKEVGDRGDAEGSQIKLRLLPEGQNFPASIQCNAQLPSNFELA